jgi:drug/metabolite transporter (DMT)-like permease
MSDLMAGELAAVLTALLWTLSALAWTYSGKRIGALAVCFLRLVIAGGMMMVYGYAVRGRWLPTDAPWQTWLLMGGSGLTGFVLCDLWLVEAFLLIGTRLSLLIFSLAPPLAAVISWACLGDSLSPRGWAAMGVTLAGVAWVVMEQPTGDDHPRARRHWGLGVLLAVLAAVAHAVGYVLSKRGIGQYDAVGATLIRAIVAMLGYVVVITFWGRWTAMLAATRRARAMVVLTLGAAVGPFAGVALSLVALRLAPTGVVATIIATMPVLILPFSVFLHREKVSLRAAAGALIAVAGVAMLML